MKSKQLLKTSTKTKPNNIPATSQGVHKHPCLAEELLTVGDFWGMESSRLTVFQWVASNPGANEQHKTASVGY